MTPSPLRITHVLYGGLGGHATVVFDITEGSTDEVSLVFLGQQPPLAQHTALASDRGYSWTWVPANARDPQYQPRLLRCLRRHRPNVIVVHSAGALLPALALRRLPRGPAVVYVEHHSIPLREPKMDAASRMALRAADAVVVLSEDYASALQARFSNLPHDRVHVVANGVDIDTFRAARRAAGRNGQVRLTMQSRLTPIKDHATLLRAVRLLIDGGDDLRLSIAGDGPEMGDLTRLASELDLADIVEFTGVLAKGELVELLGATDLYVHATLGEASSTAILQAMAAGLPVVASRVPGVEEMIPAGAGALVPPQDPAAMAEALQAFISDPERRLASGAVSRTYVERHHSLAAMRDRYAAIIRSCAGGKPVSPTTVVDMTESLTGTRLRTLRRGESARTADYLVWPNAEAPRIVMPRSWRAMRKMHAMGVLGGGKRYGVRRLLRTPVMLPVYWWRARKVTTAERWEE